MTVESLTMDVGPVVNDVAPKRYLRALVAVGRSSRRREYMVVHFGSGSFFRTDRLGALVVRALIDGHSDVEAMDRVDRIEPGSGARARQLLFPLEMKGAMTRLPPAPGSYRRGLRRLVALAMGPPLSILGQVVRLAPTPVVAWMFESWPSSPLGHHVWRSNRVTVISNLRASGYAERPEAWLLDISRRCAAVARNYFFMYLMVGLSPGRLRRLVERLFDNDSADDLAVRLEATGATVAVFLHGPLCVAVPNALRMRGRDVVRAVVPLSHGNNVSERSGPLGDFFGDPPDMAVDVTDANGSGALLRHLKAGRSVYLAMDGPGNARKPSMIEILGHSLPRNDWPAWLAVRSGRPLALWTSYNSPSGVVIDASPSLHPDPSLPIELRVAALSERLYAYAEAVIRQRPEAWTGWSFFSWIKGAPTLT
jgi:hypothetical protein